MPGEQNLQVLFVLDGLYPTESEGGGAERQVRILAAEMRRRNNVVDIIVPKVPFGPQETHTIVDESPVYRMSYPKLPLLGSLALYSRLIWYLSKHRKRYDIIHAHIAHRMAAATCLFGKLYGKPVTVKLTGWLEIASGMLSETYLKSVEGRFMKWLFGQASSYQAISQEIADLLRQRGYAAEKINLIPNAVDTDKFAPPSLTLKQQLRVKHEISQPLVGIFVGRLVAEKSLPTLFEAWQRILGNEQALLIIVGNGPLMSELRDFVDELDLNDSIKFLGGRGDVAELLSLADFGLLPSVHEGLSNTLLEYMSAGLPVIGTTISGTKDLITDHKHGALFEPEDVDGLCDCLQWIAQMPSEERQIIGQQARAKVVEYASIDSVTDKLITMYKKLLYKDRYPLEPSTVKEIP